ncbi:MAG: signal peptidase I [Bacilli bacterium]|nr:signal peptidase I [Bacilli bacterium]
MKENKKNIIVEIIPYIIIVVVVVLIRSFIVTPVKVDGSSMVPTLSNNEILILKKYDHSFERFDIVVFDYKNSRLIKRVIGLPGDYVEYKDDKLFINGKYVKESFIRNSETADFKLDDIELNRISKGCYFVMGDNRNNSTDSRIIGEICEEDIKGSTNFIIFPFNKIGEINKKK